jgi:predicted acetyltransferase
VGARALDVRPIVTLDLRLPRPDEEDELLRAYHAAAASDDMPMFLHYYRDGMSLHEYLAVLADQERGINLPTPRHVPSTFIFAFVGSRIVGRVSIRHRLNDFLLHEGGHIGYMVLPEFRRRGYATELLRQALQIARAKCRTNRLLVTCDDDNLGSMRTIEKNGGVLENIVEASGEVPLRRYWIEPQNIRSRRASSPRDG